jgi:hypothetical protein
LQFLLTTRNYCSRIQSTTLQNLPNEVDKKTPERAEHVESHTEATPEQERVCNEQAAKFIHYKRAEYGPDEPKIEYVSHFDPVAGTCYVESGFYFIEGKTYPSGKHYGTSIFVNNAFSEGSETWSYGFFGFGSGCAITPSKTRQISCRSKEEFDDLVSEHFGITLQLPDSVTKIAESTSYLEEYTLGQFWKDAAYCHQHRHNSLQFPAGLNFVSCWRVNSDIEANTRLCKTQPENPDCEIFLKNFAMIEAGGSLPPNAKISAVPAGSNPTWKQFWEDRKYCYQNPTNNLLDDGSLDGCGYVNAAMESREKDCKNKTKDHPETCKSFLKEYKDLKAGRL